MDETILERFNDTLKPDDLLYHLGDVAWSTYDLGKFFGRLRTKNIQLILGNHDKHKPSEYRKYFQWVGDIKRVTVCGQSIVLCHYPIRSWLGIGHGSLHLYGHCHGTIPSLGRSMDVGVDTNYFKPYDAEDIVNKLIKIQPPSYEPRSAAEGPR